MNANRRPGTTLIEVLIAMGILSIGMLAILAMFPIGVVNMARAITQDRASTHAANADSLFRYQWKNAWNERIDIGTRVPHPFGIPNGAICRTSEDAFRNSEEPMLLLLEAHPTYGPLSGNGFAPGSIAQPSFPVLVDPVGWLTNTGNFNAQQFVGGNPNLPVRTTFRRNISLAYDPPQPYPPLPYTGTRTVPYPVPGPPALGPYFAQPPYPSNIASVVRYATMLDDLTFDQGGEAYGPAGQLERGGRFTASWLIQRAANGNAAEVNLTVLLFAGRSPSDTPSIEEVYPNSFVPGYQATTTQQPRTIVVNYVSAKPGIRKGGWVSFSTPYRPVSDPNAPTPAIIPTLDFYRVTGVNDDTNGQLVLELESAVKNYQAVGPGPTATLLGWNGADLSGTVVFFDNLTEVFDRGTVSAVGVLGR